MKPSILAAALAGLLTSAAQSAELTFVTRTLVSSNNANFDISVVDGAAAYNDAGANGNEPGVPSFTEVLGDGTVLDYDFVGNEGTGSLLTTYASGVAGLIPTPTSPSANVHGNGEDWANVWTVTDPDGFTTVKDHNPTNTVGAANTFARSAEVDGTISYNYTHGDRDGSRARFMGAILVADNSSAPLAITEITYERESNPDNIVVELTFNSTEGSTYTILTTDDLSQPLENWLELNDSFQAAVGASSTTVRADFNINGLPLSPKQFFAISENN